jgi:gliding motility-associated protein GldM
MAGGKQTPRQRMINILYLVLLGLIALNVPETLLDSFKKIGDSLATSTKNVQSSINTNYSAFDKHLKDEPEKAKPIYDKAKQASALADKLYNDVEALKTELVAETGGVRPETGDYNGRDNMEAAERLMIKNHKGEELKKEINDTRDKLMALLSDKEKVGIQLSLDASDPIPRSGQPNKPWEEANFGANIPVAAVMTTFVKIQSDAKNDEAQVTKKLLSKFDQAVVNLDKFEAVAVAPSSYIISGQPYTAQVFLTASDSHSVPNVSVGGSKLPIVDGKGVYTVGTSGDGIKTWTGTIVVKQTDGTVKTYNTTPQTYQVAKPSAVVSPDKMLVLYIGVENPLSVSAPGVPVDKIHVTITNGTLSGSNGHYMAKVSTIGTAKVTISGEMEKGKITVLGSTEFRVKRIPPPKAQFAGKSGGATNTPNLRAADKLFAHLDNFDFDAKFVVKSFKMFVQKPHQDPIPLSSSSADLTAAQKAALATITPGSVIYFDDILAVGPDGTPQQIDPIIIRAQ